MPQNVYQFDEFEIDLLQKTLRKNGEVVSIQPKAFDVLAVLISRNKGLISQADLMSEVWGDTFVEDTNLRICIHALRKIFDGRFIETVPKRGYRFNADVVGISLEPSENNNKPEKINVTKSHKKAIAAVVAFLSIAAILTAFFLFIGKPKTNEIPTIAVLPFTEVGEKTDKNLGVTEAVISQLKQVRNFRILSIDSGKNESDLVLQGSFRKENEVVKVSASLQNTMSKETRWTENFDVSPDKELGLETSIAARFARLFSMKMVEYDDEKFAKTENIDPEALNAYLSARKIWRVRDLGRVSEMSLLLKRVNEREPNWAFAKSANAESLLMDDFIVTNYDKAETIANKALEMDAKQFGALTVLGQVAVNRDWQFAAAENYFKQSIELNPNYASTYNEYAKLLSYQRNFAEAERMAKKALEIEPFSPLYHTTLCEIYYFDQKIDSALKECKLAMQFEPNFWLARKTIFWIYVYKKMNKEVGEMILEKHSDEERSKLPYFKSLQAGNLDEYWRQALAQNGDKAFYLNALMYLQINEKDKALDNLEKATEGREWLAFRLNSDSIFEPLLSDNRFIELQKRLKNPNP